MKGTLTRAFRAVVVLVLCIPPSHAESFEHRAEPQTAFRIGLAFQFGFSKGRTEASLNGVPLRVPETRNNMSCPPEGSCAFEIAAMLVAAALAVALITNASKNNDR